jgi:arylsulfatase A-like enzyme
LHFNDVFWSPADMLLRSAYAKLLMLAPRELKLGWEDIPARKRAPDNNRALLDWIGRDPDRPVFAVVNYMDVHDPYLPPEPFRSRFATRPNPGGLLNWELHVPDSLSAEELQGEIDAYDGAIAYLDHHIGALLTTLRSRQRSRDLVVVLTSDHGEEFGEHGQYLHGNHLYREVIHVPLIVWGEKRVPAGKRLTAPVTNASIAATIANLLQPGDETFQGPMLQAFWSAQGPIADSPLPVSELEQRFWESERSPVHDGSMWSVVSPSWHYISHETRGEELYRWPGDAREAVNLAKDPALATVVDKLRLSRPRHWKGFESANTRRVTRVGGAR